MDSALEQSTSMPLSLSTALTEDEAPDEGGAGAWESQTPAESAADSKELTAAEIELDRWDARFEARSESEDKGG